MSGRLTGRPGHADSGQMRRDGAGETGVGGDHLDWCWRCSRSAVKRCAAGRSTGHSVLGRPHHSGRVLRPEGRASRPGPCGRASQRGRAATRPRSAPSSDCAASPAYGSVRRPPSASATSASSAAPSPSPARCSAPPAARSSCAHRRTAASGRCTSRRHWWACSPGTSPPQPPLAHRGGPHEAGRRATSRGQSRTGCGLGHVDKPLTCVNTASYTLKRHLCRPSPDLRTSTRQPRDLRGLLPAPLVGCRDLLSVCATSVPSGPHLRYVRRDPDLLL